jgi:molecular chaperone DnaK (HSP70)
VLLAGGGVRGGLAHEAGPWAIAEFLEYPQGSRFLQSFKSVAANAAFEHANLFEKRFRFEELGQIFLQHLLNHGGAPLRNLPERIVVGRPVRYVGARPDVRWRGGVMMPCSLPWAATCITSTNPSARPTASPRA